MTKEERLLRQEQRERAKAIEAAPRTAGPSVSSAGAYARGRGPDHAVFRQFPLGLL